MLVELGNTDSHHRHFQIGFQCLTFSVSYSPTPQVAWADLLMRWARWTATFAPSTLYRHSPTAQGLDGVEVDSIRPFSGAVDRRGQIALLADVASNRHNKERAAERFVSALPQTMTAGWAILLDVSGSSRRVAASAAAPEDDGNNPVMPEINGARILDPESEQWIPEPWALLDAALAATPVGDSLLLILGRPGGPDFLASEVEHLGNLGRIAGAIIG